MKGRKKAYDNPVSRHITMDSWIDDLITDCKYIQLRPSDILEAGLISILKSGTKQTLPIMKSFLEVLDSRIAELSNIAEDYRSQIKVIENLPENVPEKEDNPEPLSDKWYDNFHAVRFIGNEKIFLLAKNAYNEQPDLFENLDDKAERSWSEFEKFYAIEAVMKVFGTEKGSVKG